MARQRRLEYEGAISGVTFNNGSSNAMTRTDGYDDAGRWTSSVYTAAADTWAYTYDYDDAGRRTRAGGSNGVGPVQVFRPKEVAQE